MAGTTGFEPATSDVTGRRSNQLNYVPTFVRFVLYTLARCAAQSKCRIFAIGVELGIVVSGISHSCGF